MHPPTLRALGFFLCSDGKASFPVQMVCKTKGQVLFFFFFSSQHLLTTVENRGWMRTKKIVDSFPSLNFTITTSGIITFNVRRERYIKT